MTRTLVIDDSVCIELLSAMLLVDVTVTLLCVNWSVEEVTRTLVNDDPVCTELLSTMLVSDVTVTLRSGDADVGGVAEATAPSLTALVNGDTLEDPFTVIIRVIWRIRNDECILVLRKACGKRDKKGFAQLATEEMEQSTTRWKVSLYSSSTFIAFCSS